VATINPQVAITRSERAGSSLSIVEASLARLNVAIHPRARFLIAFARGVPSRKARLSSSSVYLCGF
jgi:hypothetical protein